MKKQLNYLRFVLSKRPDGSDPSFSIPLFEEEMTPYDIGHHAISALYNNALRFDPDSSEAQPLDRANQNHGVQLLNLYEQAIERFTTTLSKMDPASMNTTIQSPISGRDTLLADWLWTTVMHTIHHMGQAFRLQGIAQRRV